MADRDTQQPAKRIVFRRAVKPRSPRPPAPTYRAPWTEAPSDEDVFEAWFNQRRPELERLRAAGHLDAVNELLETAIDAQSEYAHHADRLARIRPEDQQSDWARAEREYRLDAIVAQRPMIEWTTQLLTEMRQHLEKSTMQLLSPRPKRGRRPWRSVDAQLAFEDVKRESVALVRAKLADGIKLEAAFVAVVDQLEREGVRSVKTGEPYTIDGVADWWYEEERRTELS